MKFILPIFLVAVVTIIIYQLLRYFLNSKTDRQDSPPMDHNVTPSDIFNEANHKAHHSHDHSSHTNHDHHSHDHGTYTNHDTYHSNDHSTYSDSTSFSDSGTSSSVD